MVNKIIGKGIPEFNKRKLRYGENEVLYADIRKMKKMLNWKPKTPLLKGLKNTIETFQEKENK